MAAEIIRFGPFPSEMGGRGDSSTSMQRSEGESAQMFLQIYAMRWD